ncbi:MAG: death domain-containing protein [Proteobacteria bacterium]|nr:death domain-containing protein [Pseudomonadota bacterium]
MAKALDMVQEDIDMIKTRHSDDDEEACREMLATWLEGNNGEVSWTALTQALIDAGLPQLADSLKDILNL